MKKRSISSYEEGKSFEAWEYHEVVSFICGDEAPEFNRVQNISNATHLHLSHFFHTAAIPAMDKFFNDIQKTNKNKPPPDPEEPAAPEKKALPKGVVLGKDGKP